MYHIICLVIATLLKLDQLLIEYFKMLVKLLARLVIIKGTKH